MFDLKLAFPGLHFYFFSVLLSFPESILHKLPRANNAKEAIDSFIDTPYFFCLPDLID